MKTIVTSGKRKTAIARATLKEGKGIIKINKIPVDIYQPFGYRLRIQEPLMLAQDVVKKVDINVKVKGGGPMSQSDAARLAIARALSEYEPKLKNIFLEYDRQLLVADVRFKEQHKPNRHGRARAKKQKSYR
ncbi:MAG: 30S ribosomal protein S9 [Candidatus Woesearchaeota archaeon]